MKKVININFQGRVIPIEENAYELLNRYVESLRKFFANEEGRDEIINDIEGRVAELFGETLKKGGTCITEDDVNRIIDSMGRPEDFDGEEANVQSQLGGEQKQQKSSYQQEHQHAYTTQEAKKLYRDENNKVLGGVCSGMANYFGIDPLVARILFVIFIGVTFVPYLILWVAVPSTATKVIGSVRKRLFRDPDDKVIAGVCSGLSQYFGVSIWIPRLLFLIPFFSFIFRFGHWGWWDFPHFLSVSFSPGSLFIYVILWMVLPEAKTSADKLEMKGEKVDLNNIKNTIQNDLEGFGKRAQKFGEELGERASTIGQSLGEKGKEFGETVVNKSNQFANEASTVARKKSRGLGDVIILIVKIFAYFILGSIIFAVVAALFGLGVAATGLMPAKSYLINQGWQNVFAWGTLLLFIWVPVVGIVVFIIRRITKMKGNSNLIRYSFSGLWTLGWVCLICLIASLSKEFKYKNNPQEENIVLQNARVGKLEVKANSFGKYYRNNWFEIEPFASLDEDTVFVRNVRIRVLKASTDSFSVKMVKFSNGSSKQRANSIVNRMNYNITQSDSTLLLEKGISITPNEKFRNQNVIVTIAVPVGKKIIIRSNSGWHWDRFSKVSFGPGNDWDYDWYNDESGEQNWRHDVEYIMTEKGLKRTDKKEDTDSDYNDDNENYNEKLKTYQKSKEELQKEFEETQRKAEELKKELENPGVDSSKYKYKQTKPTKTVAPAKTTVQEKPSNMSNLLMLRYSI
jgi:phage shock protein PspC (stress-responsive transcriptional regulator)